MFKAFCYINLYKTMSP